MKPMKLRSHLLLLTLGTLLPMLLFALIAVGLLAERERTIQQRSGKEFTHALITAVDAELDRSIATLQALAASPYLDNDALRAFHADAVRVLPTQRGWSTVTLATPKGDPLLDAKLEYGAALPAAEPDGSEAVARTGKPAVLPLMRDSASGVYRYKAAVPVVRNGRLKYLLSAAVDPQTIRALLDAQRLPSDWVGEVLDSARRLVARTSRSNERWVGEPPAESLVAALNQSPEGWFHGKTSEGTGVYTSYHRSGSSGWSVAISIPEATVRAGLGRAGVTMTMGVIVALIAALLLAAALGHRIAAPIGALAATARALASGQHAEPPPPGSVRELRDVSNALTEAASAVRTREGALRSADRTKDEFLAMLSHELRTPLGALAAAAHVLRVSGAKEDVRLNATGVVERQVRHMSRLVEDLLDVSRVTRGKISLARQPLDLAQAARNAVRDLRDSGRLEKHQVALALEPAWVHADSARIEQIITNLVGNAVKYTDPGGKIVVMVRRDRGTAILQVRDNGIGMSTELASRAFDLFVQGERPLDRGAGGLGIGLTMVRRLAELHGGTAHAASAGPGQGSLFTVALPAIEAQSLPPPSPVAPTGERRRHKILVIEDSDDARRTLSMALRLDGHEVYEAADGKAGLAAAESVGPEVALIDIGLPGLNGYQVAEHLREMPAHGSMVLIALTGYGQPEAFRRARDAGFDDHIVKPVVPGQLVRLIDVACAAKARGAGARS
jgi:signal transduction histidine kinase/CheY-like chemotaxis protein